MKDKKYINRETKILLLKILKSGFVTTEDKTALEKLLGIETHKIIFEEITEDDINNF